jgi:hypothetical protein
MDGKAVFERLHERVIEAIEEGAKREEAAERHHRSLSRSGGFSGSIHRRRAGQPGVAADHRGSQGLSRPLIFIDETSFARSVWPRGDRSVQKVS